MHGQLLKTGGSLSGAEATVGAPSPCRLRPGGCRASAPTWKRGLPIVEDLREPRAAGPRQLLIRYLVIGGLSVAVDVGLLFVLHTGVGVRLWIATTVAYLVSLVFNFACNRIAMASGGAQSLTRHAVRYGVLVVANLVVTVVVVTGAEHLGVPYVLGKLAVVAASTCWNFVLYRRWVFVD